MSAVNIKLHGHLGEAVGEEWSLHVRNSSEALSAINVLSKRKLYRYLAESDKKGAKYRVLINGRDFASDGPLLSIDSEEDMQKIRNSELFLYSQNLKTIDIIPILEGANAIVNIIVGVVLIIIGIVAWAWTGGASSVLIVAGLGLIASGISALLMDPPEFEDVRSIQGGGTSSYLFNGPQNIAREGGPVPFGYGELLIGSQVLSATYSIGDVLATQGSLTV